jgi:hypothetical protein
MDNIIFVDPSGTRIRANRDPHVMHGYSLSLQQSHEACGRRAKSSTRKSEQILPSLPASANPTREPNLL